MRLRPLIFLFIVSLPLTSSPSAHAWAPIDEIERAVRALGQARLFGQCDWSTISESGEGEQKKEAGAEEEPDCE